MSPNPNPNTFQLTQDNNNTSESPTKSQLASPELTKSSKKKIKKPKVPPINIDEVFNQISTVSAQDINPPIGHIVLTPRSAEAVLKLGINPEVLKLRDIDSFWEPNIDPSVQRLRHEAYIQRRHELMKECRKERRRIMNAEFEEATTIKVQPTTMTAEMLLEQQKEAGSTLIANELKRIEKMQKRQEKELESMIQFEVTRAKIQQDMAEKLTEQKKKDELRKKQQEKRLRLMAEERHLKELQRAAQEEVEEQNRREVAKKMHEEEMRLAEAKLLKEKQDKKAAIERDMEKRKKHEEHMRATKRFFEEEEQRLRARLESMHSAEEKKQAAILEKQAQLQEEQRLKREAVERRLQQSMEMMRMIEDKRKTDFWEKHDHHEQLRAAHLEKVEHERNLHAQEIALKEQRRRMILLQTRKEEEKKAESMLQKFEDEELHVMEIEAIRKREHDIQTEKKNLKANMKIETVERVARVKEYKRMNTLKKIEETGKRVEQMLAQKQSLIQDRRDAARKTKMQKEQIAKVMEELRGNASKANKIISMAMTGKVSLADLTSTNKKKRPNTGNKKKTTTTNEILRQGTHSASAGSFVEENDTSFVVENEQDTPKPYKSPYEAN